MADAQIYLILTNHGAGDFGEEYNRRTHFIYLDGENILTYKPGGFSCEPYRRYNSQGNGIYGREPLPDEARTGTRRGMDMEQLVPRLPPAHTPHCPRRAESRQA